MKTKKSKKWVYQYLLAFDRIYVKMNNIGTLSLIISLLMLLSLAACGGNEEVPDGNVQLANPWKDYESLAEAEEAAGFVPGLPDTVGEFEAAAFRCMDTLLEVRYSDGDYDVIVRRAEGEGQDISGVYGPFDSEEQFEGDGWQSTLMRTGDGWVHIIYYNGCSWSLYAPKGYPGDSCEDFNRALFGGL